MWNFFLSFFPHFNLYSSALIYIALIYKSEHSSFRWGDEHTRPAAPLCGERRHLRPEAVLRLGCVRGSQGESRLQNIDGVSGRDATMKGNLLSSPHGRLLHLLLTDSLLHPVSLCLRVEGSVRSPADAAGRLLAAWPGWGVFAAEATSHISKNMRVFLLSAFVDCHFYLIILVRLAATCSISTYRASSDTMTQYLLLSEPQCKKKKQHSGGMMMVLLLSVAINRFT